MKKFFSAVAVSVALTAPVYAQDSSKAVAAYTSGDYATAVQEWRPLAEQGDASAQVFLGNMYYNGQGILQDNVVAHMWWNISSANGNELGGQNRDNLAKEMTPQDISKAQAMARECMSSNYQNCGD
mmetsp:Transcript_28813/g.54777  ORF Transcript_28813/g.54777 Transcript_28813/m.54777 type:complete len:126 (-) Transcript_28813:1346-1723(-)